MASGPGCSSGQCEVNVDVDEFGQPLQSTEPDLGYSEVEDEDYEEDDVSSSGLSGLLTEVVDTYGDLVEHTQDSIVSIITGGQDTVGEVFTGGQQTLEDIANRAAETVERGQDIVSGSLNPLNFFGAAAGGTLTVGLFVVGGAFIADQTLAGGAWSRALLSRLAGRRR